MFYPNLKYYKIFLSPIVKNLIEYKKVGLRELKLALLTWCYRTRTTESIWFGLRPHQNFPMGNFRYTLPLCARLRRVEQNAVIFLNHRIIW